MLLDHLILTGVRQNNLKGIDVKIPLGKATIITGPSGSGKSSLAFETIFAEGQRRYMESLSTYARQFLDKFRQPDVDKIENIPPTIALEQINPVRNSRATVGTSTELYDYLRLLFEKIGHPYCKNCNLPMVKQWPPQLLEELLKQHSKKAVLIGFKVPAKKNRKELTPLLEEYIRNGFTRLLDGSEITNIENWLKQKGAVSSSLSIIVDRIQLEGSAESHLSRFSDSLQNAVRLGHGEATLFIFHESKAQFYKSYFPENQCPNCGERAGDKTAASFSFNSPLGACQNCKGFGNTLEVDENLVVPYPQRSLAQGAIDPFTKPSLSYWQKKMLEFCKKHRIDADLPYQDLPPEHRKMIFDGTPQFKGVRGVFKELEEEKYKLRIRVFVSRYTSGFLCKECKGSRLNAETLQIRVGGKNINEMAELNIENLFHFLKVVALSPREKQIAKQLLEQCCRRLEYLSEVGLGYLQLNRLTRSLSGGEYQRVLLSTQLSQGLTDTLYVLDEPSIGLHPKDTSRLLSTLNRMRNQGNSLVIVEHDPEMIEWGDYIIELGPGSGKRGGTLLFSGEKDSFLKADGLTSQAVSQWVQQCQQEMVTVASRKKNRWFEIKGATSNNLKNIDIRFPLNSLVTVTGVSGSGKSTLIVETLFPAIQKHFGIKAEGNGSLQKLMGLEFINGVELVDQSPIGRSSRSNPITFVKGFDEIRSLFAGTPDAVAKRLTPGHFSFNVPGGRCEKCQGEGRIQIDMVFLEDVWIPCEECDGKRFKKSILRIRFKGKNIDDVLKMTIDEAYEFFSHSASIRSKLNLMRDVGLGYLQLGQPGPSLSGGESQRLKISRELTQSSAARSNILFIFDEPTTGLHFREVGKLIAVLRKLTHLGHSVLVIEHNLQLICSSDYVIDLGPEGGDRGGQLVDSGTPLELAERALPHTGLYLSQILRGTKQPHHTV